MPLKMTVLPGDARHAAVQVEGVLDFDSTEPLTRACLALVDEGRGHIVLDVSGVDFCDSSGLNTMIKIMNHAKQIDGSLSLVGATPALVRLLEMTGVGAVVHQYSTTERAFREQP